MLNKVDRDPDLMNQFANELLTFSQEIQKNCKDILMETENARNSKIISDHVGLLHLDSLDAIMNSILEGTRDNIEMGCKIKSSAQKLLSAIEEGRKLRGR